MAVLKLEDQTLTFNYANACLTNVLCNIEIEDDGHWNKINVISKDESLTEIQDMLSVNVEIDFANPTSDYGKKTVIKNASVRGFSISFGSTAKFSFSLYPEEVYLHYKTPNIKHKRKVSLSYFINKSPMIAPYCRLEPSENGSVTEDKSPPLRISSTNGINLRSDISFTYALNGDHFNSERYQIITTTFSRTKNIIDYINNSISREIDDVMLLSSLLHDNRVTFLSWKAEYFGNTVFCYKSNKFKSADIADTSYRHLIDAHEIEDFYNVTTQTLKISPYKPSIKNAINSLMISSKTVVELSYLSYFQALESMILTYKRIKGTEFILETNKFKKLRQNLEKSISSEIPDCPDTRAKIKSKLAELNRISLREAGEEFFKELNINMQGLWPLFDNKHDEITGLVSLRNVLIHG
ncbi:hypothetical protein, partial [Erwinia billingiae]|uniref:hypothetical protein n=1 Tax=Erwinia billingiae TaxID=182337 RepID=UPI00069EE300